MSPDAGTAALARARVQADQQRALNDAAFDLLVIRAARLQAAHTPIVAWSILSHHLIEKLGTDDKKTRFAAEMLASAALHRALEKR